MYLESQILSRVGDVSADHTEQRLHEDGMVFQILMYDAYHRAKRSRSQHVEFLAKALRLGQDACGNNVVLGTPLYVAVAE